MTWRAVAGCLALLTSGCINMDVFLLAPAGPVDEAADLMAAATEIPNDLRSELRITAEDGGVVDAYLLAHRADDGTPVARHRTGILYCHGNLHNMARFAQRTQALWKLGYTVLLFDYRGYGKTRGRPTEAGFYKDARASRQALAERGHVDASRIALYGYSLGGAVATQLAAQTPTPALILESTFSSVEHLVDDNQALDVPSAWYLDAEMNTAEVIKKHRGALLVVHGTADTYVQAAYGRQVWEAAGGHATPNLLWLAENGDHNTVPCLGRPARSPVSGGCVGGFDPAYLQAVANLVDQGIPP